MKLLHLTFRFEFEDRIESILDRNEIQCMVRHPMVPGKDRDGKHYNTKIFPGGVTLVQAQVPEDKLEQLLRDLESFKNEKNAHKHLEALILDVKRRL